MRTYRNEREPTCECAGNQLTELNVQGLTALQDLHCSVNQLTKLNVQSLNALKGLACYGNRLNADAFKKLFDDLPQRANGARCWLYTEETGVTEGNHTDFSAQADLAAAFNNAKTVKSISLMETGPGLSFNAVLGHFVSLGTSLSYRPNRAFRIGRIRGTHPSECVVPIRAEGTAPSEQRERFPNITGYCTPLPWGDVPLHGRSFYRTAVQPVCIKTARPAL